jgi:hypothetical protein
LRFPFIRKHESFAQGCCSGGSANPITGGGATGVLKHGQMEIASNYQFFTENRDTFTLFDNLSSNYLYLKAEYGLSKKLTLSLTTGYFFDKTLTELGGHTEIKSKGLGDLIIFPRYSVFNNINGNQSNELTVGLGYKPEFDLRK